jgi:hypothetical protein
MCNGVVVVSPIPANMLTLLNLLSSFLLPLLKSPFFSQVHIKSYTLSHSNHVKRNKIKQKIPSNITATAVLATYNNRKLLIPGRYTTGND